MSESSLFYFQLVYNKYYLVLVSGAQCSVVFKSLPEDVLIDFRERGKEGEGEGEGEGGREKERTSISYLPYMPQLRIKLATYVFSSVESVCMCLEQESNPPPFGAQDSVLGFKGCLLREALRGLGKVLYQHPSGWAVGTLKCFQRLKNNQHLWAERAWGCHGNHLLKLPVSVIPSTWWHRTTCCKLKEELVRGDFRNSIRTQPFQ